MTPWVLPPFDDLNPAFPERQRGVLAVDEKLATAGSG